MTKTTPAHLDPVALEVFAHRLWAIGEEGRIALQRVSASPVVQQGGECMCSFYTPEGAMIIACSGHLRFAAATSQAIKVLREWYGSEPGFADGDQIFLNDPYVAGAHVNDQMVVKPIFHGGKLIAWTASSSHTVDVGGPLPGAATEIFSEGIRILGLKVVEGGRPRPDVFRTLTEQCRDPYYVGLDLKSRIASNNVCAAGFLELVERFGADFVEAAARKMIADAELLSRRRIEELPDGRFLSRVFGTAHEPARHASVPYEVICTVDKLGSELSFDFTGTSPQTLGSYNSTENSSLAHLAIALTNILFWDVPWNDGKMAHVKAHFPEGSILNCRYPAATFMAPRAGNLVVASASECLAKMLYAAGRTADVNASWYAAWYLGGPGSTGYGGHDRNGLSVPGAIYDIHAGGLGAAPHRDGVDTGGHMNIPSGGISDVERVEQQYPFLYLARRHNRNGSGPGRYRGGVGSLRIFVIRGSADFSTNYMPYEGLPNAAYGLGGGYPVGPGGDRLIVRPRQTLAEMAQRGDYPVDLDDLLAGSWGESVLPDERQARTGVPEGSIMVDFTHGGGGFGDPIDRDPQAVWSDIRNGIVAEEWARRVYGVATTPEGVEGEATAGLRASMRSSRIGGRAPRRRDPDGAKGPGDGVLRLQENLAARRSSGTWAWECARCGEQLGSVAASHKTALVRITQSLEEYAGRRDPSGRQHQAELVLFACPGCGTLVATEISCPSLDGGKTLFDFAPSTAWLDRRLAQEAVR